MKLPEFTEEDEDTWVIDSYRLKAGEDPIRISIFKEGEQPSSADRASVEKVLEQIDSLVSASSPLILDNYSKDYFETIAKDKSTLPDDTPESIQEHITLREIYFFDITSDGFEISFEASWDPHHSFDIEFEGGEPQTCAVNG